MVAMYTDFFFRRLRGGSFPLLAAYSSTKNPSSTANCVRDFTYFGKFVYYIYLTVSLKYKTAI